MLITFNECIRANGGKPFSGVIHIGAHEGEEIEMYSQAGVRNVIWFEANKTLMKTLYDKTKMHPVKQQYVCEVLSDTDGDKVEFHITNNGQSSSMLKLGTHKEHYPHITVVATKELITKRFDTFCRDNVAMVAMEDFDFVNLDVQGAELKVLKGFGELLNKHKNIKAIYSEVNFEEVYTGAPNVAEIDEHLIPFGFKRVTTSTTPYGWGDALYLRS